MTAVLITVEVLWTGFSPIAERVVSPLEIELPFQKCRASVSRSLPALCIVWEWSRLWCGRFGGQEGQIPHWNFRLLHPGYDARRYSTHRQSVLSERLRHAIFARWWQI